MDRKSIDFARHWAKRYVHEHHPYGLDESDVENMILRRLHYNKDKGERGRKAALSFALNEAQNEGRRNFRSLVPWQMRRGMSAIRAAVAAVMGVAGAALAGCTAVTTPADSSHTIGVVGFGAPPASGQGSAALRDGQDTGENTDGLRTD